MHVPTPTRPPARPLAHPPTRTHKVCSDGGGCGHPHTRTRTRFAAVGKERPPGQTEGEGGQGGGSERETGVGENLIEGERGRGREGEGEEDRRGVGWAVASWCVMCLSLAQCRVCLSAPLRVLGGLIGGRPREWSNRRLVNHANGQTREWSTTRTVEPTPGPPRQRNANGRRRGPHTGRRS